MILLDINQTIFSSLAIQLRPSKKREQLEVSEDLLRHMVLNSLRSYRTKFVSEYGELIICSDSKHSWRREIFPYYKHQRKEGRKASPIDWPKVFEYMNALKHELREVFPYQYVEVDGAEADDVIATIVEIRKDTDEPILIISGDKDFVQLQRYHVPVKQYNPIKGIWVSNPNPNVFLEEHIITGDVGDGIPNIKSPDNTFVVKNRQGVITKKFKDEFNIHTCNENLKRNYYRNKKLIDLTQTPQELKDAITSEFENGESGDRSKLFNYFAEKKLKNLMQSIGEF